MNGNMNSKCGELSSGTEEIEKTLNPNVVCRDYIKGYCSRENCRFVHEIPPRSVLKDMFQFCHDFQNKSCFRTNCKFIHASVEAEDKFYSCGVFPRDIRSIPPPNGYVKHDNYPNNNLHEAPPVFIPQQAYTVPPPPIIDDSGPEAKLRKILYEDNGVENHCLQLAIRCKNCDTLEHKVKLLHDNISVLLKKVGDLTEKNLQLTTMNEFLLQQTASVRSDQPCVITSRHGTSAPVSLATVSMTPIVSLAGALPTLVPAAAPANLTLAPAASRAQLLTPAPQILTVSTTQQLVGNSGALIVTSAGGQQLMQVSDSGTLMGGGQTVVAVTPSQLTLVPPSPQLMTNGPANAVQQLVQQSAQQLVPSHQAQQFAAAQQSLAMAQQSQNVSAQQLACQQSAQQLAQQSGQQMVSSSQLVHQPSGQQITISSANQAISLANTQTQGLSWDRPMISQNILPH